jgi:hypothetical protein
MDKIFKIVFQVTVGVILSSNVMAQGSMVTPIEGAYGQDYIIINYVDWGQDTSIKDAWCSTKTYDFHQGTDFQIRNFAQMDSGVFVLAADTGIVIFTRDGEFDREKTADPSKGLGNYIGIAHAGKLYTYYGHLRNGSLLVNVGDPVLPGTRIAQVGSSGNSSDPHLHFELWYDSLYYIDPFGGPCGNLDTYWKDPIPFDSSFQIWSSNMCNFIPELDTLREEPPHRDSFFVDDEAITYWSILYGLRAGDALKIDWFSPEGTLWHSFSYALDKDRWYYYYWAYINTPLGGNEGIWTVELSRNDQVVQAKDFYFSKTSAENQLVGQVNEIQSFTSGRQLHVKGHTMGSQIDVVNQLGLVVHSMKDSTTEVAIPCEHWPLGVYFIRVTTKTGEIRTLRIAIL